MSSPSLAETPNDSPLHGVTVVAIEQAVSAPICSRTLADLGARVIKIENPRGGDFARYYDDVVNGLAAHFVWANRGKESVTLDLKQPEGMQILHRLLASADVLVSNLGPGATARLGLSPEILEQRHPGLITLEISGYGNDGPLAHKRAYDLLVQAESGACATTGWEGHPAKSGPPMIDVCTGLYAAIGILAALHERGRTGSGARATVAMLDTAAELMTYSLTHAKYTGHELPPVGLGSPALAPYGAYSTNDGCTVVLGTTNDGEWRRLATMIGRPELGVDERFRHNADRVVRRKEVDDLLGQWCDRHTLAEIQSAADRAGIGNARYNTPLEVVEHPQLVERQRWTEVPSPAGPVTALLPPVTLHARPPRMGAVPGLGEHSETVLSELGFTQAQISALCESGVTSRLIEPTTEIAKDQQCPSI